jgi:hypothetical protein
LDEADRRTLQFIEGRKRAYCLAFGSPSGIAVMDDLTPFCRGAATCFHADARIHAALEGRREVWLRIQEHLNLTPEQLFERYAKRPLMQEDDNA